MLGVRLMNGFTLNMDGRPVGGGVGFSEGSADSFPLDACLLCVEGDADNSGAGSSGGSGGSGDELPEASFPFVAS